MGTLGQLLSCVAECGQGQRGRSVGGGGSRSVGGGGSRSVEGRSVRNGGSNGNVRKLEG